MSKYFRDVPNETVWPWIRGWTSAVRCWDLNTTSFRRQVEGPSPGFLARRCWGNYPQRGKIKFFKGKDIIVGILFCWRIDGEYPLLTKISLKYWLRLLQLIDLKVDFQQLLKTKARNTRLNLEHDLWYALVKTTLNSMQIIRTKLCLPSHWLKWLIISLLFNNS